VFTLFEPLTEALLALLAGCFNELLLAKPFTSKVSGWRKPFASEGSGCALAGGTPAVL
jgi:hypothetical protein